MDVLPDVPAIAETVSGYEALSWAGIGAPAGTPQDIIDKLNKETNAALAEKKLQEQLAGFGVLNRQQTSRGQNAFPRVMQVQAHQVVARMGHFSAFAGTLALAMILVPIVTASTENMLRLVPNAPASTIFALVGALGRGDRKRALDSLDTLFREGEYLPLALTFLATQFRLAMAARDSGLKTSQQIQAQFTKQGIRIWRDRAEQVSQTVGAFPGDKLGRAMEKIYGADKALRDTRPDDRVVMEELVLSLTS